MGNPRSSDSPDIRFDKVTKRFGDVLAVDSVSLSIERGEFFSFLGPSGCGKTTSLRLIAGFEQPTQGNVHIGGVSVIGVPPHRRPVNMVFQHYALFPHMTVADNIGYGLRQRTPRPSKSEIFKQVDEILEMVQMSGYGKRRVWELSGGQQQRVALARALINRPTVLLLDEPLAALDRKLRRDMQIELQTLQRDVGITFILVTHDQEEALSMSDRICIMRDGRIVQIGKPAGPLRRADQPLCRRLRRQDQLLCGFEVVETDERSGLVEPDPEAADIYRQPFRRAPASLSHRQPCEHCHPSRTDRGRPGSG